MNRSIGEVVEIVILVLFLAYGTTLGIKGLYDVFRETCNYSLEIEDKNAATKLSDVVFTGDYDTLLTQGELCLMTQIQDLGMPEPNTLLIGGQEVNIDITRFDNTVSYIAALNRVFQDKCKYLVRYDYRTSTYYCTPYLKTQNPASPYADYTVKEVVNRLDPALGFADPMIRVKDGFVEFSQGIQHRAFSFSNVLKNGKTYLLTFRANSTADNDLLHVDAFPDDLPEKVFSLSKTPASYSWLLTIPKAETGSSTAQLLRFFISSEISKGQITVADIELTEY